jgi:hypothetical protein
MNDERAEDFESSDALRRMRCLRVEIRALKNALELERRRNTELLSSTSWKLTAPLRALVGWLKGNRIRHAVPSKMNSSASLPYVPPALRKSDGPDLLGSNETFVLVDARDAMAPLLDARASCRSPSDLGGRPHIAVIVSNELQRELVFDASVTALAEGRWEEQLRPGCFDYVLLETIWRLDDGQWRYSMIAGSGHGSRLEMLLAHCRSIALPVVLWFREDVANYDQFSWLVEKVDRTYAIDEVLLRRLKSDFPDAPAALLPPAVQPRLHNPIRSRALQEASVEFSDRILLDGWWDVVNDKKLVEQLLAAHGERLRICESEWDFSGARLLDSHELMANTLGCCGPREKAALARLFPFELFLTTSMRLPWKRRLAMLRTAACGSLPLQVAGEGTLVGRQWSAATGNFAELKKFALELAGQPLQRMRLAQTFAQRVVRRECIADRLAQIASDLSLDAGRTPREPRVAAILVTMRPQLVATCIDRYRREQYPEKELVIVLHGDSNAAEIRALAGQDTSIRVMTMGREHSLGACLNYAIDSSDAPYWSKFDDDDYYGPSYLQDVMSARRWVDFDIAGKPPMFSYLQRDDALYWDPAWAEQGCVLHSAEEPHRVLVAGATLTGRREVLDDVAFSGHRRGGADSDFLRRSLLAGHDVLGLDGFGFVRFRSDRDGFHTHQVSDAEVKSRSVQVGNQAQIPGIAFL